MKNSQMTAPGPSGFFENRKWMNQLIADPLVFFTKLNQDYGKSASINLLGLRMTSITDANEVKYVLQENSSNYTKSISYNELKHILGQGLLTSEGSFWKRQRRIVQPAFKRSMIEGFSSIVIEEVEKLKILLNQKSITDISEDMMKITFTVVGRSLFQKDLGEKSKAISEALETALFIVQNRMQSIIKLPLSIPTGENRKLNKAIKTMFDLVEELIVERRKTNGGQGDLLDFLMFTKDEETSETMSDMQIRDEVITFLLAGHETTSNALTWTFYLLSKFPYIRNKVREEVKSLNGSTLGYSSLEKLEFTKNVVQESMRLYPPIWIIERSPIEDDLVGGFFVPKKSIVSICINSLHRNEEYWENPEGFDPDRFLPENSKNRPGYSYLPFGGGPRICIGNHFAMMEAVLILASLIDKFNFDIHFSANIQKNPLVTLRPKYPVWMSVKKID
jgi:cytochrome P450